MRSQSKRFATTRDQASLTHHASPAFWASYRALPPNIWKLADQAYERFHFSTGERPDRREGDRV
jgi:hypothetical protein